MSWLESLLRVGDRRIAVDCDGRVLAIGDLVEVVNFTHLHLDSPRFFTIARISNNQIAPDTWKGAISSWHVRRSNASALAEAMLAGNLGCECTSCKPCVCDDCTARRAGAR